MSEITGMYGIHKGSWMTNLDDMLDAVREYDYDLGESIYDYVRCYMIPYKEWFEMDETIWDLKDSISELEDKNKGFEKANTKLHIEYDKLTEQYEKLKEEYEKITSQLDETSGFHFVFEEET